MLEALFGAMVEDGGFEAVGALAARVVAAHGPADGPPAADAKSRLQMAALAKYGCLPVYRLLERRGAPHQPTFRIQAALQTPAGPLETEAEGSNRQGAEQEAANQLLRLLPDA
jgi:dsRNA-specific ribonuclease